jgi:choline dehydrogenase-like flavoprotein
VIDLAIIGSGFGGAVMAARLGAALRQLKPTARVVVFEKGQDPTGRLDPASLGDPLNPQGNRFKNSLSPSYLATLAQLHTDPSGSWRSGVPSMSVVSGMGLGGGSNVYDGVSLRAPTEAFEQLREGRRLWPSIYSRASLEPYYALASQKLKVVRLGWTDTTVPHWQLTTRRDFVFAEGCRRIGATAVPLKVATFNDANDGWWNEGQRFEGRQSLGKNYLLDAQRAGVELWSGCEIDALAPIKGGYLVRGSDHRSNRPIEEECRMVIVAGGAVGSTELLLKSLENFEGARELDPGDLLGRQVSGNGDYGVTGVVGSSFELDVEGHKGKPMSSFCPSFFPQNKFILIPFYAAPLYLSLGTFSTLMRPKQPLALGRGSTTPLDGERDWGLEYKLRLRKFGSRMLTMGCLALDGCEGSIGLSANGKHATVRWGETTDTTEKRWSAAVDTMRRIYEALGGEMFLDGYRKDGTVHTAHPLGGCRMAERGATVQGVVDPLCESLNNKNLFVIDGAAIPSALGANPSLTIAAVAECVADRLVRGQGTPSLKDRLP